MKNTIRNLVLVSSLTALAASAPAQVLHAAGGAAGAVAAPVIPPPSPPPPANIAAHGAASSAVGAQMPVLPPVDAHASGAARSHATAGVPDAPAGTPNLSARTHASAEGEANGVAFGNRTAGGATVGLNTPATTDEIRGAAFTGRDQVRTDVEARLNASSKAVKGLQARAEAAGEKSRKAFAKALVEVRQREKDLRASLKASAKADGESSWGKVQSDLARDYGAYAQAVARAEVAAGSNAGDEPKS